MLRSRGMINRWDECFAATDVLFGLLQELEQLVTAGLHE